MTASNKDKAIGCGCLFLILFVFGFISAFLEGNGYIKKPTPTPTPTPTARTSFLVTTAQSVSSSYESNEINADGRYKNKRWQITGEVKDIGRSILGSPYVMLKGDKKSVIDIQIIFKGSQKNKVATLYKGYQITVEGNCDGLTLGNVVFSDGELR